MTNEEQLIAAESARRTALEEDDADALEAGMADTFHYAHINGLIEDREAFLSRIRSRAVKTHRTSTSDLKVFIRSDVHALMTGKSRIEFEWADGRARGVIETLFLAVWERRDARWKISAYASTPLPEE